MSDLEPDRTTGRELELRRRLKECDAKLARYRALLEHDSEITIAATWIAEVERERRSLERGTRSQADQRASYTRKRDQGLGAPTQGHRRRAGRR